MSTARTELGGRHGRGPQGTDPATPLRFGYTPTVSLSFTRKMEIIPGLTHIDCKLLPFYSKEQMGGFLDMTQLIKASPLDWSSLDSFIQKSSTYGGETWSLPWTFDLGTIAAHAAATWSLTSSSFTPGRQTRSSSARTFWTGMGSRRPPRGVTCWSWPKGSTAPTRRRATGRATCSGRASIGRTPRAPT